MESSSSAGSSSGSISRRLSSTSTTPPPVPGFIGEGHTAVEVLAPTALAKSDPFVLLMDDRLDIPRRRQIGGAHPHAGLETVTLVLEGTLSDRDEGDLQAGDVIWMTAGRGIIHNEAVEASGRSRILQLWIALPTRDRGLPPRFEVIRREAAPVVRAPGVEARLYSGASGTLRSATRNRVAVTLVELTLAPGATFHQTLPASYSGFFYVVDGEAGVGHERVAAGQVGWLAPAASTGLASDLATDLEISASPGGAHLVLYAGEPIGEPLVQHGPFVAGSSAEIAEFHRQFRAGRFTPMSQVARAQRAERTPS
ncbi:MAG TPA: pirin-like C-terminal cupin domain-containing protein [Polyangia bacterium]|nr:pirin-like C-terminal cupin domain-containing protein [Polyangia bacterium]